MEILKALEPVFIEMSTELMATFDEGDGTTPEERIEFLQELIDDVQKNVGDSLLGRMMTAMFEWHIDQVKLEIRVFN